MPLPNACHGEGTGRVGALGVGSTAGHETDTDFTPRRAKYVNVTLALDTTRFLSQETEYMPWEAALNNLQYFQLMFDRSEVFGVMTVSGATAAGPAAWQGEQGQGAGSAPRARGAAADATALTVLLPPEIHKATGDAPLQLLQEHHR